MKKLVAPVFVVALIAVSVAGSLDRSPRRASASICPPGFSLAEGHGYCLNDLHPENFMEVSGAAAEYAAKISAPFGRVAPGAYGTALRQRQALIDSASAAAVPGAAGTWHPYGKGPLISSDPRFDSVNGEGLDRLSGRVDSLDYDKQHHRLFASIGTGGVWASENGGNSWHSIGDKLPTQIIGAIGYTPVGGGTLVAVGGEPLMGGDTYTGFGGFWTNNLGKRWHRARGLPKGVLAFQVAVDKKHPNRVYAGTSQGLFVSRNAGRSFRNAKLPTGPCKGKVGYGRCEFANFVTDVVVMAPGGTTHAKGGTVLAAVGYRAGKKTFSNGKIEGMRNGLYRSKSGKPGTFKHLKLSGFAPQERIGRTELGIADGKKQNHKYVYAIVEDARLFNEGQTAQIDAPEELGPGAGNTVFNGIYVSKNFGKSWIQMADTKEISDNPKTGSALVGTGQATLYAPGVQSWYNEWIKVDPTRALKGVPTRILFGLEEVWMNRHTDQPQNTADQDQQGDFRVIGPYFAGKTCLLLDTGIPECPTRDTTDRTTHPDQHDAIFVPSGKGGVTLFVGNDGGVFKQRVKKGQELTASGWGNGRNDGFHTLLPYQAAMAKDGRTWFGLQDNGSGYIDPSTQKYFMTFGGDGFYVATDPDNSDVAYSEVTAANMRVTTDGGQTWRDMGPIDANGISGAKFANPFVMDPTDANHLMTAGQQVVESTYGPDTQQMDPEDVVCLQNCWQQVYDLGSPNSMSALDLQGDAAYVGICGPCDLLNNWDTGFKTGLATNVGGTLPPKRMTSDGWHIATAQGLPNRYITSVAIDPNDTNTVYVTLGGYSNRQWVPPGSYLDRNKNIGRGHVYKSTDAGEHFTNVSKGLPNAPAFWVEPHGTQLVVATQVGVFLSSDTDGTQWAALNRNLPLSPVNALEIAPGDPDLLVAATFGRGVYTYRFS